MTPPSAYASSLFNLLLGMNAFWARISPKQRVFGICKYLIRGRRVPRFRTQEWNGYNFRLLPHDAARYYFGNYPIHFLSDLIPYFYGLISLSLQIWAPEHLPDSELRYDLPLFERRGYDADIPKTPAIGRETSPDAPASPEGVRAGLRSVRSRSNYRKAPVDGLRVSREA